MKYIAEKLQKTLFFDREDWRLAQQVEQIQQNLISNNLSFKQLHPAGILELVESRILRIIKNLATILDTSSAGKVGQQTRSAALALLREEVRTGLEVPLPLNTGRVLLAWGKEVLRCAHTRERVRAIHAMRTTLLGNPIFIRRQLRRFHLLEMPEHTLPLTFDYHVHDSNTKGRKSPSHLIMDAWIKGLRKLQVIYYNVVPPEAAAELLKAAELFDIDLRIGVEFRTLYRGQVVDLIWVPRGFSGADDFLKFLARHNTAEFHVKCLEAARFRRQGGWSLPPYNPAELPEINRWSPVELIAALRKLTTGFRIVLNLTGLSAASAIELLYDCRGGVTTLEIYNLKDALENAPRAEQLLNLVRHSLNAGDVVKLKYILRAVIREAEQHHAVPEQLQHLREILLNMPEFINFYARSPLGVALGSDSIGRASATSAGMGLAVVDSLSRRTQKCARREKFMSVPVFATIHEQVNYAPRWHGFKKCCRREWIADDLAAQIDTSSNLIALGGPECPEELQRSHQNTGLDYWSQINSCVKIVLKILLGFAAAFLTFYWGQDHNSWWLLTYGGAVIWLGITLLRNIVQQALAGGSLRCSKLLKLNDFISWQRIADSLFYTGLSVPLLEYLVKNLLLHQVLGWTAESHPIAVFTGIGLANGLYLTAHNLLRAFPARAVWGNWLRVPLSIPLALLINSILAILLGALGVSNIAVILQQWAAVISKFASDMVGGVVEAAADRARYLAARTADVRLKFRELGNLIAEVELLTPEDDVFQALAHGKSLTEITGIQKNFLLERFFANTLDLMYMWMRQPRGIDVICKIFRSISREERIIFRAVQELLTHERQISRLLLDGAIGGNFAPALTFYLRWHKLYLKELQKKLELP